MGEEAARSLQLRRQRIAARRPRCRRKPVCRRTPATPPRRFRASWSRPAQCEGVRWPIPRLIFSALRAGDDFALLAAAIHRHRVEEGLRLRDKTELAQPRRQHGGAPMHRAGDVRSAPPARDRPHTSRRSPPAAPARCRCWRSPFRGGYAARGSAAPGDRPAVRANRSTGRRCARAASVSAHRAPPCRRRAARHSPSARRTAAPNRWRYRRRVRRARPIASAPGGRRRRWRARPWRAGSRSPGAGRAPRRTCPDIAAAPPKTAALSRSVSGSPTISFQPKRLGAGAQHGERLRMHLGIDEEGFCLGRRGAFAPAPWLRRRRSPRRAARHWRRRAR